MKNILVILFSLFSVTSYAQFADKAVLTGTEKILLYKNPGGNKFTTPQAIADLATVAGVTADGVTILGAGSSADKFRVDTVSVIATKYDLNQLGWKNSNQFASMQEAFDSDFNIVIDAGEHIVGELTITKSKIITGSENTVLKQVTAATHSTRVISIYASNVEISNLKIVGQIATQTDEQSHAIMIRGSSENISLKNLKLRDLRGDGIIIAAIVTDTVTNINIENVMIKNVYRNGVAIIGGQNIYMKNMNMDSIGLLGLDIEPNVVTENVENVTLINSKLPSIAVTHHLLRNNKNVLVSNCSIDNSGSGSSIFNPVSDIIARSNIQLRNIDNITFEDCEIFNAKDLAIKYILGAQKSTNVNFTNCIFFDNGIVDSTVRSVDVQDLFFDNEVSYTDCSFTGTATERYLNAPNFAKFKGCDFSGYARILEGTSANFEDCDFDITGDLIYESRDTSKIIQSIIKAGRVSGSSISPAHLFLQNNTYDLSVIKHSGAGSYTDVGASRNTALNNSVFLIETSKEEKLLSLKTPTTDIDFYAGVSAPESVLTSKTGAVYFEENGLGLFYKKSGTGNTGWSNLFQNISLSGNDLTIADGNTVDISGINYWAKSGNYLTAQIVAAEYVGIGSVPDETRKGKLQVDANIDSGWGAHIKNTGSTSNRSGLYVETSGNASNSTALQVSTIGNGANSLSMDGRGFLGIGIAPSYPLHMKDAFGTYYFESTGGQSMFDIQNNTNRFRFGINPDGGSTNTFQFRNVTGANLYALTIDDVTSFVGINTNSTTERLHVEGNARITGAIYDSNNQPGTAGQILSTTVTGTDWIFKDTYNGQTNTGVDLVAVGTVLGAELNIDGLTADPSPATSTTYAVIQTGASSTKKITIDALFTKGMDAYNDSLAIVVAATTQAAQTASTSTVGEEFWWRKTSETGLIKMRKE
jgi:hypothetical protein